MGRPYAFISQGLLSTKAHRRISGEQYAKAMLSHITVPFEAGTDASPPFCLCRAAKSTLHYQRRPLSKLGTVSYCRNQIVPGNQIARRQFASRIAPGGASKPPHKAMSSRRDPPTPRSKEPSPLLRRGGSSLTTLHSP
jgi:hypothetical protein